MESEEGGKLGKMSMLPDLTDEELEVFIIMQQERAHAAEADLKVVLGELDVMRQELRKSEGRFNDKLIKLVALAKFLNNYNKNALRPGGSWYDELGLEWVYGEWKYVG